MIRALHSLLVIALVCPTYQQGPLVSPCPGVFQYDNTIIESGKWYGTIKVTPKETLSYLNLNIVLDSKADLFGNWIGEVTSLDNIDYRIDNASLSMPAGVPHDIKIFAHYNSIDTTPKLKSIKVNGAEICDPSASSAPPAAPPPNLPPSIATSITTDMLSIFRPNRPSFDDVEQCGRVATNWANALVVNGKATNEGQWPWHIALYRTEGVNSQYLCGGTLVSRRHVITAGHCVTREGTSRPYEAGTLTIYLGRNSLSIATNGIQVKFVEEIKLYPDYNGSNYYRDLAILYLRDPATYTAWVRHACLWPDNEVALSHAVGLTGTAVGWGIDSSGYPTQELNMVQMPVVDQETCLRSHAFFQMYTSDHTFCAGHKDGSSVCNGDSGGGLLFQRNGAWYLRGVVSLSVAQNKKCDPTQYVIFTDIAKYFNWIKRNI